MRGARSKLDAVSCGRIAEKLVPSSDRLRRIVVAIALVAVVAASLSAAGTAAASENGAVYVNDDGYVEFVDDDQDGKQTKNATEQQADVVGTAIDLNGDGNVEAPVVDGGTLRLVRPDGTNETLVADGVAAVAIAVDDVDGNGMSDVLYVNESDGNSVWRVSGDGETRKPRADVEATAVAGYGDFNDGDDADETVFVGASQGVKYVDDNGSVESTGYGDVAGVGPLANYDGDSETLRVAVVDGSNNEIKLIDADGNEKDIGGNAAATPIGKTNLYGDEASEVVYVNEDDDQLEVVGVNDSPRPVTSGDSPFEVDDAGAAGGQGIDLTPPPVTVGAPENRTYIKYAEKVPLNVSAEEEDTVWNYSIDSINDGEKVPFEPNTYLDEEEDLDPGKQYNLTVYAEDSNGNVRTIERTFGVGESGSTVVYVDDESGKLSYIPPNPDQKRVVETSVSRDEDGGFIAAGPAIHYDADGQLDIPYVREGAGNDDESPLKLYHVADGTTTTIEKNAMDIGGDGGKIATADFDDDGRFDIVYRGEDKNLKRVDGNDGPDQFVDEDTDPQAIIGSADVVEGDDEARGREIVWVDASSEVKAVSQYSREVYSDEELSFNESLGSNDNVGAGEPLPIVRGGPKYFPIVDGSANPGVLNARDGSYQQLANDDDVNAKKAPVGLADINDDAWKELLFIDDNGEVKYAKANPGRADNEIRELGVDDGELVTDGTGEAIEPDASVGVVATHFAQRVNDYYEYPGDDTAPSVEILEPADTEYEDEVPIDVRTDEPIDKWYYSVDGNETQFDGPQQLLTDLSRGSNTITVRVVDFEGKEDTASETFQVTRADPPDESEAAPQTTPQTATAATATPAPTATPTPTPATAPAATPTPTTTSNTTSTPTATSTAESTSNTATTGAEQAGSLNWVFPLLVLVVIAIAVFAVRQRDREE
jgi:hypothetical protein